MFKCRKFPWKITLTFNNIWWSVGWKKQTFNYPICSNTVFSTHHRLLNSLNSNLFNSRCFSRFFCVMFNQLRNRRRNFYTYIYQYQSFIYHTHSLLLFIVMRDQHNNIFTVNNLIRNLIIRYDFLCAFDYYCMAHWTLLLFTVLLLLVCFVFTLIKLMHSRAHRWKTTACQLWSSKQNNVWCYIKL